MRTKNIRAKLEVVTLCSHVFDRWCHDPTEDEGQAADQSVYWGWERSELTHY